MQFNVQKNTCSRPEVGACCLRTVSADSRLCLLLLLLRSWGVGGRMRLTPKVSLDPALSSAEALQPVTTQL